MSARESRPGGFPEAATTFPGVGSSIGERSLTDAVEPPLSIRRVGVVDLTRCADDEVGAGQAAHALADLYRFPSGASVRILVAGARPWLMSLRNLAMIREADSRLRLQIDGDAAALDAWSHRLFEVIE